MKTDIDNFFFIGLIVVGAMLVFFLLLTVLYCVKAKKENQLKKESLLGSTESPLYT